MPGLTDAEKRKQSNQHEHDDDFLCTHQLSQADCL